MKRAYTIGEKSLFAAPLLFIALGIGAWAWRQNGPIHLDVPLPTEITTLSFSPDGKKLAVSFNKESGPTPPTQIIDLETRSKICELPSQPAPYSEMVWSPEGKRIAWAYYDDSPIGTSSNQAGIPINPPKIPTMFSVWDAQSGVSSGEFPCGIGNEKSSCTPLGFSSDGSKLISNGKPPALFDANTGKRLQVFSKNPSAQVNLELGLVAQFGGKDSRVQVLDLKTGRKVWESRQSGLSLTPQGLVPPDGLHWNGDILSVYYTLPASVQNPDAEPLQDWIFWDGKNRKPIITPAGEEKSNADFSSDGKTLCFINRKNIAPSPQRRAEDITELVVWDYRLNRELWRKPTNFFAHSLSWSPDGKWLSLLTESPQNHGQYLQVFDRSGQSRIERIVESNLAVWSPDSSQIAIASSQQSPNRQIELVKIED